LIRRYLLARSAEQFSRVKIGALHSGKGYRGIKEEQEEEERKEKDYGTQRYGGKRTCLK
jgi:IS5 family transposase